MATEKIYADLPLSFTPNPITGDIAPVSDDRAVKQGIINLLLTPVGSRPFNTDFGTDLNRYLFEAADSITESELNEEIADSIKRFEPRAQLVAIESSIENNELKIRIDYYVVNVPEVQTVETTITRTS